MFSAINRQIKRMALRHQKSKPVVFISDTTLRDGCQTPGLRLSVENKVRIARALADAGVHSIDCGFPASSDAEREAVRAIARNCRGPILSAHSRAKREDIDAAADALSGVSPFKRAVTIFIGVSPLHREHKHRMSRAEVIKTAVKAIEYAQSRFEVISFGPEDASRAEPDFLHEIYKEVIAAGALSIGFTDTVGTLTPDKAADAIKGIQDNVPNIGDAMIGVHYHNDLGLATANSLASVKAGANTVQGTINGIGERAGNVALEEVVVALVLGREEYKRGVTVDPARLHALSRLVEELTRFPVPANKAVVGRNIFRTETGVHQDGLLKNPDTYLPFPPELIGAGEVELMLGPNSGRSAVRHHLAASGVEATEEHVRMVLDYLKHNRHDPGDMPEVQEFLERIRPFMSQHEPAPGSNESHDPDSDSAEQTVSQRI